MPLAKVASPLLNEVMTPAAVPVRSEATLNGNETKDPAALTTI